VLTLPVGLREVGLFARHHRKWARPVISPKVLFFTFGVVLQSSFSLRLGLVFGHYI
jgi:hypothetical protein